MTRITGKTARTMQEGRRNRAGMWIAGIAFLLLLCPALTAPGSQRQAWAQGISPTQTPPTPYQCMYVAYSFATETSVVVGVRNNSGATTRLSSATLDWPSDLSGDYVDYFTFHTGTFYTGNDNSPPTFDNTIPFGNAYNIANNVTREFVAGFGPLPLPTPLAGSFSVTLTFSNGCSVSVTMTRPEQPTPTLLPTNTPAAGECNISYAYASERTVVFGIRNNTAATVRLSTTTLDWPSGLGGSGGDYVDYFQLGGNQFYNGNDTAPATTATPLNTATYDIAPGETRNFVAAFGPLALPRPLYGTFTGTFTFRSGCAPISASVTRDPPPGTCPTITNAYVSSSNLYFNVYNNLGMDTFFTGADLDWTDNPTPNRYVNFFEWGTDRFYTGDDYDPPTSASDSSPDMFTAGEFSYFRVNFGNAGELTGSFSARLYFSYPCSTTYTLWWGVEPTPTQTATPTETPTPIPLAGAASIRYPALLLNAPDFGLPAQTIGGSVLGGGGPPYIAAIYIKDPEDNTAVYTQNVEPDGTFELLPAETGDQYLGCSVEGIWEAWFIVTDSLGGTDESNHITWAVNFPRAHGIP